MKRILSFVCVAAVAALLSLTSLTSCKTKVETNYVDLMLGRWRVESVNPELPDKKYFVAGDEFVLNSDMTLRLDNNWAGYFSSTRWTIAYDLDEKAQYISMTGVNNEKDYSILFARISGITENEMSLEYTDESISTTYRFRLKRVN